MAALKYWLWLSSLKGLKPGVALQLVRHFGSPEKVFAAKDKDYRNVEGIKPADVKCLVEKDLSVSSKILADCAEVGCRAITFQDSDYPDRLRNIYDPPLVLYVKGRMPDIDEEPVVGVVGTRECTPYGVRSAELIASSLARRNIIVATGLARGIDTAAARAALNSGGGVIGVIGSGIGIIYPPENRTLFDYVAGCGIIVSEYPPNTPALKHHFPARNRIISGLSLGVVVVEAPLRSGALITASRALEQGRDVFTLPGNIDVKSCEGSNALLREGAIPVLSAEDIIAEYEEIYPDKIKHDKKEIDNTSGVEYIDFDGLISGLSGDAKTVAVAIGTQTVHIDDVIASSGLTAQKVLAAITMLEINGYAMRMANGCIKINNKRSD